MAEYTVPGYPQILKHGMTTAKVKETATCKRKTYRKKEAEREEKEQYEWKLRKIKIKYPTTHVSSTVFQNDQTNIFYKLNI